MIPLYTAGLMPERLSGSSEDKQRNDGNLSTKGDGLVSNDTSDSETEQSRVSVRCEI